EQTMHDLGGDLYVVKSSLEYKASAVYDDLLQIGMRCQRIGNSSITFQACAFRGNQVLVTGEIVYVYADPVTQSSKPVPQELRDAMLGYEQGETMVKLQLGSWMTLKNTAGALRTEVFVEEQGVDQALEWDEFDARSLHAVLRNRMGLPVATGRLLPAVAGVSKIGRMAVKRQLRGLKLGDHVLNGLLSAARQRGDSEVVLHAQCTAENFYQRQGFTRRGEVFVEADMDHVEMFTKL
ncbi:MAG: GNAT family N-acetyltransferase, partial [Betaproteobacteria bacterium]|nr:GNAT family N-acetyltransferase [Betaproteobacteria bacterium]